jgi:DNA-binding NtrC family response regulator
MVVTEKTSGTYVEFTMAAHTPSKLKSLIFGLMRGIFRKAMKKQVVALKAYCEQET